LKPLVEILDLTVIRGEKVALRVDHLVINKHEVMAIMGPNGAGKSTLLLVLARLLKPDSGEVLYEGKPAIQESDLSYRRRIALVMQDPLLFDSSVYKNVAAGLQFRGVNNQEIQKKVPLWLERLGVGHLIKRRARELSGGEAQRVSLARAMALEPTLLLLDEPFSSLDPPTRRQLIKDMNNLLSETGTTAVFVTHNFSEITSFVQKIAVITNGYLNQVGTTNEVIESPINEEVAKFLLYNTKI